jgi:starch-binding outer membrane protein, SusD/RagB family
MLMQMKNIAIVLLMGSLMTTSCNKFLDVTPKDLILEDQVFSSEAGINNALNGVYLGMTTDGLYGGSLTLSTVEVMAQRYDLSRPDQVWRQTGKYNYNDVTVQNNFNSMWRDGYKAILNVNTFIQHLRQTSGILPADRKDLLLGEAYGLRAMIHFDLLRVFGPVYVTHSDALSVPYYRAATPTAGKPLPATEVVQYVLNDLDSALILLKNDPLISAGVQQSDSAGGSNFYRYRNLHFNYYAAKAMMARVQLYAGKKAAANALATEVITAAGKWFPWGLPTASDHVFSTEVIFGVQNLDLYGQQTKYFSSLLNSSTILAPIDSRLISSFDGNLNDYRFKSWWKLPTSGGKDYHTFFKYDDPGNSTSLNFAQYLQPLIRMTEMYYIAAETATDPTQALKFLNTVRFNRGLPDIPPTGNLQTGIRDEYIREFSGEGQLFFYYKRKATPSILNGSVTAGEIDMADQQYVVPLPLSETQTR